MIKNSNPRGAGRKPYDGKNHTYKVTDATHEYIKSRGGGKWLNDFVSILAAKDNKGIGE